MPPNALLLIAMPLLIVGSAFFSGSETALFGMSEPDRLHFRRSRSVAGRAVGLLLADQRMLLITIMLGNMTINALYFVVSSVLMLQLDTGQAAAVAIGSLLAIILFGEVLPKMIGNARRLQFITFVAPILATIHQVILPLRVVVEKIVVLPLSRLTAPTDAPPQLDEAELTALLDISGREGVIDREEQRVIREVFSLGRLRVRDVMTPRVQMHAVPLDASREEVVDVVGTSRLTRLPVFDENLDSIVGLLPIKRYLVSTRDRPAELCDHLRPVHFVPQMATLDQLMDEFRRRHIQSAIVVDEFGGTAGIVAMRDIVEEVVGEIVGEDEPESPQPAELGDNRWRVSGDMSVHDWAESFGQQLVSTRVATLGGLITQRLGRSAAAGDVVDLGNVRLEVESVDAARVESVIISLQEPTAT